MRISVISFTGQGVWLSRKLKECLREYEVQLYTKYSNSKEEADVSQVEEPISDWAGCQMKEKHGLIFIGACGIAVRAIAPHITDKLQDVPVLVMDEQGQYVIPLLSGHVGGANELARDIERDLGAQAVISTATDLNRKFAVDLFAKKNHFHIYNKDGIAKISAKVLRGEKITIAVDNTQELSWSGKIPEEVCLIPYVSGAVCDVLITSSPEILPDKKNQVSHQADLYLIPKEYILGAGCKKGKDSNAVAEFLSETLHQLSIEPMQLYALASIDLKREEPGFLAWSAKEKVPFVTYSAEVLSEVEGSFSSSEFVKHTTGVDNVCERSALKAAGEGAELIYRKHAKDGMTAATARRRWSVSFDEA